MPFCKRKIFETKVKNFVAEVNIQRKIPFEDVTTRKTPFA
jgi:hypothetical protein